MKTRSTILWLTVAFAAAVGGCATEYDDPSSECIDCAEPDPAPSEDGITPPSPTTAGCQQACSALLYECRPVDEIRLKGNVEPCIDWCQNGGLNEAEVSCLADADCSSSVEHCLIDE